MLQFPMAFFDMLLIAKSLYLVVALDDFLSVTESILFIEATLITEVLFKKFLMHFCV